MPDLPPVFLWPVGRSGGTLFTTMLGVHSALAMSYEIYEEDLRDEQGGFVTPGRMIAMIREARQSGGDTIDGIMKALPRGRPRSFIARALRGGLPPASVLQVLKDFDRAGGGFAEQSGRLDFIESLMRLKMKREDKTRWGGKAKTDLEAIDRRHPDATVFMMIRDGRDILASRSKVGNFEADPAEVARDWSSAIEAFRRFAQQHQGPAQFVAYERLVKEPREVLEDACSAIGITFEPGMLRYEDRDLTLTKNPYGHLSAGQIAEGLNENSIGRWRDDLAADAVRQFEEVAAETLESFGYELANSR